MNGPWMILIIIWSLNFASLTAKADCTLVNVRFLRLNLVYYDESFLSIGFGCWEANEIDQTTL